MSATSFWRDRRVFVTGHTGFKGSWLALWLGLYGARTTGYALPPPTTPCLYDLAGVSRHLHSIIADINDAEQLAKAVRTAEPEIVFHLAAQPLVRDSYAHPVETFATNVMGTVRLLEAVRSMPSVRAVIVVTTDKCYRNEEWVWGYRETDALGGRDPYSASKAAAELVAHAYRSSFFGQGPIVATARAGNVCGGGDFARDRLLPDFVRAIERGSSLDIRNPEAVRPWQFVLEPLRGYLEIAERAWRGQTEVAEAWNFGPDEQSARSVRDVVEIFASLCGEHRPADIRFDACGPGPHEATLLKLDTAKARARLAWRPCLDFETTLALTARWYRGYLERDDLRALSERQLEQYIRQSDRREK
ncbi:CDP-glucose 4,6-dehydratase [Trinickia symbiotica]|uniref:CDP-glucose 4,6-dehydratase n=1 Tax=Trinickia symbiotica TaxID=863227 RepID=A0A2T3XNR2_9BURK|nr:CDP-glucose 4,6-dehydratase [Trinickia symbiotica]PTB18138.1 CDP-glucose 4,6-dehydratase [Trinickia symbiotica]